MTVTIPESQYFSGPELSASGAKLLLRSPAKYRHDRDNHHESTAPAMRVGSAFHTSVLGSGKPFTVIEDRRTKTGKEQAHQAGKDGIIVLTPAESSTVEAMTEAVNAHETASAILSEGKPEQSIYWTDQETGVKCRARLDWLRGNAIVDLKSTLDASPDGFAKSLVNFGYAIQAAWYQDACAAIGLGELPFLFIACEKDAPHLVATYQAADDAIEYGRRKAREALRIFADCLDRDKWPGYSPGIEQLNLPRWA